MIRKGVGAVVLYDSKFLLAERIKRLQENGSFKRIPPEWDLVKGGLDEETPAEAILRELFEETGSKEFRIVKQFAAPLHYTLPESSGFAAQETIIFLVEYLGTPEQLRSDGGEISRLAFFTRNQMLAKLKYQETRDWVDQNV
jgi:putative (di)nucleoside polyphosphate hydrolase